MKHLLILSVSAGAGHVRAAQALEATAHLHLPQLKVTHLDVMDYVPKNFRHIYADSYIKLVDKAPLLWAYLYKSTDTESRTSVLASLRGQIERLNTRALRAAITQLAPDVILCTHFLPAELLSRRIAKHQAIPPVWVQVTDFDVHGLWVHPHMQGYFVASAEIAARLHARGIAADSIHVTGIPVMPQFSPTLNRDICAREIGLDPSKLTALMMSGGQGVGDIAHMAQELLQIGNFAEVANGQEPRDFQLIALAGRNTSLFNQLTELALQTPGRLFPQSFTLTVERLMAASDFSITKPGGLTSSECLAMHLPMIVVSPIPGQEERNADYLLEVGAALKAVDTPALCYKAQLLMQQPELRQKMRMNMQSVAKPLAAIAVLKKVMAINEVVS